MKRLSAIFALTFATSLHFTLACGDDDEAPSTTGGRSGASNPDTGGKKTSGGTANAGSTSEPQPAAGKSAGGEGGAGGDATSGATGDGGVTAEAGAGGQSPISATVEGRIVDPMGSARSGVSVIIQGRSKLTDAEGRFQFDDVAGSYDVLAFPTDGQTAFVYQGLKRRDPVLVVDAAEAARSSSDVAGKADFAAPSASSIYGGVGLASHAHPNTAVPMDFKAQSYGPLTVHWTGTDRYEQNLLGLVWIRDDSNLPLEYLGFGSTQVDLEADAEVSDADLLIEEGVTTRSLNVSGNVPEGYTVLQHGVEFGSIPLVARQTDSLSAIYKVPSGLAPGHLVVSVESALLQSAEGPALQHSSAKWRVSDDQTKLNFELHSAPLPVVPLEGASGVNRSTLFQWQPFAGGVHRVEVTWGESRVVIYTQEDSTKLPDVSVVGMAYPADGEFRWNVSGLGPAQNLDEWVSSADALDSFGALYESVSETRSFTISE